MMKQHILGLIWASLTMVSFGQIASKTLPYGNITMPEFEMKTYVFDPDAGAVILFDKGSIEFVFDDTQGRWFIYQTLHRRIKILDTDGMSHAEVYIPYYKGTNRVGQRVVSIQAQTHTLTGGKITTTRLDEDEVYTESFNRYYDMKQFSFPDVSVGSVLEFEYRLESPYIALLEWNFQQDIPVLYSQLDFLVTPFFEYNTLVQGISAWSDLGNYTMDGLPKRVRGLEYHEAVYQYVLEHLPAFKREGYMTTRNDYVVRMLMQLDKVQRLDGTTLNYADSWADVSRELLNNYEINKYISSTKNVAKKVMPAVSGPSVASLETIVNAVKSRYRSNGISGFFTNMTPKELEQRKEGSIPAINLFLIGALKHAGFDVTPVILSTREHGRVWQDYPFIEFFNYIIGLVQLDGTYYVVDASEPLLAFHQIPVECLNGVGLILDKTGDNWVDLKRLNREIASVQDFCQLSFDVSSGVLSREVNRKFSHYAAFDERQMYRDNANEIRLSLEEEGFRGVSNVETEGYKVPSSPYTIRFQSKDRITQIEGKYFIEPFGAAIMAENPFKLAKRTYPVDLPYRTRYLLTASLDIPEGYEVEAMPQPFQLSNDLIEIQLRPMAGMGKVNIQGIYLFKKLQYQPEEYTLLKSSLQELINHFTEPIVLVPSTESE